MTDVGHIEQFRRIWVRDASQPDIDYVVRRMRASDRREVYGVRFSNSADDLIGELAAMQPYCTVLSAIGDAGHPRVIALAGLWQTTPSTASAMLIATDDWPRIVKDVTRWLRGVFIPRWRASGLCRVEITALAALEANCKWIELLKPDCRYPQPGLGRNGEDYIQYAWLERKETLKCA